MQPLPQTRRKALLRQSSINLEPIGVVGLITQWNWPMNQIALKVIPALLAGCTCVLKPSEESPLNEVGCRLWHAGSGVGDGVGRFRIGNSAVSGL